MVEIKDLVLLRSVHFSEIKISEAFFSRFAFLDQNHSFFQGLGLELFKL